MKSHILLSGLLAVSMGVACKEDSKSKAPAKPKPTATTAPTINPPITTQPQTITQGPNGNIVVSDRTGTSFEFNQNEQIVLRLQMQSQDTAASWQWGITEMPTGGRLANRNGNTAEFYWNAAIPGTYNLTVLSRHMPMCQQVTGNPQTCDIPETMATNVQADSRYDKTQRFTLTVRQGTGLPGTGLPGTGTGYPGGTYPGGTNPGGTTGGGGLFGWLGQMGGDFLGFLSGLFGS